MTQTVQLQEVMKLLEESSRLTLIEVVLPQQDIPSLLASA
ncbi:putative decarboxylase domain protein [Candidatus Erwinia dacicola]|uniref:Decarboxylase domain protein n=1 Tax=Candidatus Erwinia dacicola TaxID=252393 RepID=A0A328TJV4_9GAMM|nr:putative decarboxylase domain protein [Candidatus Erwinia dacicola]